LYRIEIWTEQEQSEGMFALLAVLLLVACAFCDQRYV